MVARDLGYWEMRLLFSTNPDEPRSAIRLRTLNYLLDLQARWQGDLNDGRLEAHLESALRFATEDERDSGFQPNIDWMRKKLSGIAENMKFDIGRLPSSVPAQAYADWVCNDPEASENWLQLYLSEMNLPRKGPHPLIVRDETSRKPATSPFDSL